MTQAEPPADHRAAPLPLRIAALFVLLEGLVTIGYGVSEALHVSTDRLVMGATTSLFFLLYGGGLVLCAWLLTRANSYARGPVLLSQLIWLGLAWNFRHGETTWIAVLLAIAGGVTLVGILHPRSIAALEQR